RACSIIAAALHQRSAIFRQVHSKNQIHVSDSAEWRSRRKPPRSNPLTKASVMPTPTQHRINTRRLENRHILITGAGSGIGRAVAELFCDEGARLALFDL